MAGFVRSRGGGIVTSPSDEPVLDDSAIAVCGTRRVNMVDVPSYDRPDVAAPGNHLYTVGAAPLDALAPGDVDAEFDQVLDDLRRTA